MPLRGTTGLVPPKRKKTPPRRAVCVIKPPPLLVPSVSKKSAILLQRFICPALKTKGLKTQPPAPDLRECSSVQFLPRLASHRFLCLGAFLGCQRRLPPSRCDTTLRIGYLALTR